jgi:hypothetical protein
LTKEQAQGAAESLAWANDWRHCPDP